MKPSDLAMIIGRVEDLPTLPRTVLRITELVNNPKSSARDLAKVVTDDQVLTARLLRLVNSLFLRISPTGLHRNRCGRAGRF